ncbi:hypothetical protein H0H92_001651 [Tricholoma furcatifolium]|nr:hypothetical protein H0H92_001651 [Tricholoma furcatifolium]
MPDRHDINSFSSQAGQFARFGLNFTSPIAGAIPVAGGPLKAAIGALLVVLNSMDQMSQNKKDVETLIKRLHEFDGSIRSMPPATGIAQSQREKLIQDLNAVANYLKELPVSSFLRNNEVTQLIQGCIREIDEYKQWFLVLSQMHLQEMVSSQYGQLPAFVKRGMNSVSLRSK